ncbi:MAG TPA: hypothetical protein VK986_00675 [Tepidisphaeraceae bacterium]|nr:hypothetical protein [Tepidisphaeraceae bacterium]
MTDSPAALAAHLVAAIEAETIPEAWADLGVDPLAEPLVVFFVRIAHHSPYRPLDFARPSATDAGEASETVLAELRAGRPAAAVARRLGRMQDWPWGAIAADLASLAADLASRYALSPARPETELGWGRIPGGIVITCAVVLRGPE